MKKLVLMLVAVMFVLGGTIAFAGNQATPQDNEVVKYLMPAGTVFVMLHRMHGPLVAELAEDRVITQVKLHPKEADKPKSEDVVEFSVSYEQLPVKCPKHGKDTYDMYKRSVGSDSAFVKKSFLKPVPKEE